MKEVLKKGFAFAAALVLSAAVLGSNVYASDDVFERDSSGNVFGAGQTVSVEGKGAENIENELFAAGMNVTADNTSVAGSVYAAGQSVSVSNTKVGASIFTAGNSVLINAKAENNIWAAGNIITIGDNTSVKGLHVAGNMVSVDGKYEAVTIAGNQVTFNAVVSGDVEIEAEHVVFGETAKIGGDLKVKSSEEPDVSGIAAGNYSFEQLEEKEDNDSDEINIKGIGKAAGKVAFGAIVLKKIKTAFFSLFKYAVLAVILAVVFKKNLSDAYEYSTKKPGQFWGFGALILITFPLIAIITCITVIGIPVAGFATALYVLALCMAKVFTFGSLVRELIFTRTSKRLHPVAETVLAVLPAAIIKVIPVIGGLVGFACAIYTIGYVCLAIFDTVSSNKTVKAEEAKTE